MNSVPLESEPVPSEPGSIRIRGCGGIVLWALAFAFMGWGPLSSRGADDAAPWVLASQIKVDSTGVFLDQILEGGATNGAVHVRLCDAPAVGRVATLTLAQVRSLTADVMPASSSRAWTGATSIQVTRRMRPLPEAEILQAIHGYLLKNAVRDQGELEIKFLRAWTPVSIGDEIYSLKVMDLPQAGLTPVFQFRFELVSERESLGIWQVGLEARLWKNIWVAQQPLRRGDAVSESDFVRERRDVLRSRDLLPEDTDLNRGWMMADNVNAGAPLLRRSLQLRAVVQRGQMVDALLQDGRLSISLKAEVLDSGVPGQLIRLRNPLSRRELRGKVVNEQVVLIQL